jgi:hypothetical protein
MLLRGLTCRMLMYLRVTTTLGTSNVCRSDCLPAFDPDCQEGESQCDVVGSVEFS